MIYLCRKHRNEVVPEVPEEQQSFNLQTTRTGINADYWGRNWTGLQEIIFSCTSGSEVIAKSKAIYGGEYVIEKYSDFTKIRPSPSCTADCIYTWGSLDQYAVRMNQLLSSEDPSIDDMRTICREVFFLVQGIEVEGDTSTERRTR